MLSPKECNRSTRELAQKQMAEKVSHGETDSGYTPLAGSCFHRDGSPRRFPGIRLMCRTVPGSPSLKMLLDLQTKLRSSAHSQNFTFPPSSSLHMLLRKFDDTIKPFIPGDLPGNFLMVPWKTELRADGEFVLLLRPADRKEELKLTGIPDFLKDPSQQAYGITLAYQIVSMTPGARAEWVEKAGEIMESLSACNISLELGKPELYRHNNLLSFYPFK
ncbi:MAG: DUF1868 domain-containing protein [Spirochaetales bacterium]|nr:DUF1868 domain-containing protein [Spirochaetales bacterium]